MPSALRYCYPMACAAASEDSPIVDVNGGSPSPSAPGSCVTEGLASRAIVIGTIMSVSWQLFEINLIEDDTGDAVRFRPQNLKSLRDAGARRLTPLNNQQNFVCDSREGERIDDRQQRRCVHHDIIELAPQLGDEIWRPLRHQQVGRIWHHGSGGDHVNVRRRILGDYIREFDCAAE